MSEEQKEFGAPSIKASSSTKKNKISVWRVKKPVINKEKCVKCGTCYLLCPESAIRIDENGFPIIDYSVCKGCLICANECPVKCIKAIKENKEEDK